MIVIGIWNTVRNRDMIPQAVSHRPGSGGSDKFLDFIKGEVLPYVKRTYRAADFSVLYGMSNSALFAVFALLEEPETFDAYIASSPMIGHCPQFIREKAEAFKKRKSLNCRLIMIYGSEDSPRVTEHVPDFRDYLESNAPQGFRVYLVILEGAGHVPESSLALGLRYVYGKAVK